MAAWVLTFCFIDGATRPLSKRKINHLLISCVFPGLRGFRHVCHPTSSKIQQKIPKSSNQTKNPQILKKSNKKSQNPKILRHPPKSNKTQNPQKIPQKIPKSSKIQQKTHGKTTPPSSSEAPDCDRVEVQYEQQSYDKMPGFFASILMGHLDVRLEVRFNGWYMGYFTYTYK